MDDQSSSSEKPGGNPRTSQLFKQHPNDRTLPHIKEELVDDQCSEYVQCSYRTSKHCPDNAASSLTKVEPNIKQEWCPSTVICDLPREFRDSDGVSRTPSTLLMEAPVHKVDERGSESLLTYSRSEKLIFPKEKKQNLDKETIKDGVPQKAMTSVINRDRQHSSNWPQTFPAAQGVTWPVNVKQEVDVVEEECKIEVEDHVCKYENGLDELKAETGKSCKYTMSSSKSNPTPDAKVFVCFRCSFTSTQRRNLVQHMTRAHMNPVHKCYECEHVTKDKQNLAYHIMVKHGQNAELYECTTCNYKSNVKKVLEEHMRRRHNVDKREGKTGRKESPGMRTSVSLGNFSPKIYRCSVCNFTTKTRWSLRNHFTVKHDADAEIFKCAVCDFTTKARYRLRAHLKLKHDTSAEVFKCTECGYTTKTKGLLNRHTQAVHGPDRKTYKCTVCEYATRVMRNLMQHKESVHGTEVFKCAKCDHTTMSKHGLSAHFRVTHDGGSEQVKCTECDHTAKTTHMLRLHFKLTHDGTGEVFECTQCGYATKRKQYLARHKKTVHATVTYKCTVCDYTTKVEKYLRRHKARKHAAATFKCAECDHMVTTKTSLNRHFKIRHDSAAEVFKCAECEFTTKKKANLARHTESVHGTDTVIYKCTICDYTTKVVRYLVQHKACTHGTEVFKCAECDYTAKSKKLLSKHSKVRHNSNAEVF